MDKYSYKLFFKANLVITSLIFIAFLFFNNSYTIQSFLLTFMGTISSVAILYLLFSILFLPLTFFKKILYFVSGFIFVITDLIVLVDFFIFRIYKFHINAMVLNIIFSPKALEAIQIGWQPIALFIFYFLLFY